MNVKLGHANFQPSTARKTFSKQWLNGWGGMKNVRLQTENWPCLGNGDRYGLGYY